MRLSVGVEIDETAAMGAHTYEVTLDGGTLERGFWLYVWEVTTPTGDTLLYVGRTGDSSSANAQSPFNRMGQHLGSAKNSSMLRNHLETKHVDPGQCRFRLVAHGPILGEAWNMEEHSVRRDIVGALEKALADDLAEAGYNIMNKVNCLKPVDAELRAEVRTAFAAHFASLQRAS